MASPQSSPYFPPLDRCLSGDARLISWKTAYRALCDPTAAIENTTLEAFLTDSDSANFLSNSLDPFMQPSAKTKSDFETKTAPIHVPQSANGDYNLEELKKDALWLSEEANVEELTALRVVILEWQQRAEDQLRFAAIGNGNSVVVANGDLGTSKMGNSTSNLAKSTNGSSTPALDFDKEEIRRERQLGIYLEEKNYILKISADLIGNEAVRNKKLKTGRSWIDEVAAKILEDQCSVSDAAAHNTFCSSCIDSVDETLQRIADPSKLPDAFKSDDAKRIMYDAAAFADITTTLRLLLANLYMLQTATGPNIVSSWFKLMARANFLQGLYPSLALPDTSALQCLISIISLTILQLPEVLNRIQDKAASMRDAGLYPQLPDDSYLNNEDCIKELNITLCRAAQENVVIASPAIFAWSVITSYIRDIAKIQQDRREQQHAEEGSSESEPPLRRRASRRDSREDLSLFEQQFAILQDFDLEGEAREDPASFLSRAAVDRMRVYFVIAQLSNVISAVYGSETEGATSFIGRGALLELIRDGMPMVSYDGEILESIIKILTPDVPGRSTSLDFRLANLFVSDPLAFRRSILEQAIARYPYELSPLLRLLAALSSASTKNPAGPAGVVELLEGLQTLTVMVPEHFRSYTLDHEDENMNSMLLTDTLPLFISKQALSLYGPDYIGRKVLTMGSGEDERSNVLAIPPGTAGLIVKESRPLVLRLEHAHSGLEYLGLLLSTILPTSEVVVAPGDSSLDRGTAAEIITLLTTLLTGCLRQETGLEEARFVLGRFGFALHDQEDIISVITEILEVELLAHLDQSIQDGSLDLLVACAEFFDKLTSISPERVWSTLAHSTLLGINGGANALAAVVAGTEVQTGRFRFLGACVRMYSHLLDDTVAGLVKRKSKPNKTTNRFDSPISFQDSTPERTMSTVLSAYQTVMVDAWQSFGEWRFAAQSERNEIATLILKALESLVKNTYGVSLNDKGIAGLLHPSATSLLETFAPESGNGTLLQSFGAIFSPAMAADDDRIPGQQRLSLISTATAASQFLTRLIRTVRMLETGTTKMFHLGMQVIKIMPVFASLLATDHSFKGCLSELLSEIVQSLNNSIAADPPSLLGQLSADTAKSFLSVISQLDRPLQDVQVERNIWDFLSTVMSSRQQWFAIYLLSGIIPKDRLKDKSTNGSAAKGKSLLAYALDQLSGIATLPPERAMAMLKFVAVAQSTWVWATNEVRSHPDFLKNGLDWLETLKLPDRPPNIAEEVILANEHQMAAYLCDILAVNLHASLEIGDKRVLKVLAPKLEFLRQHGVAVDAYNRSLHKNLAENFARKFSSCEVASFKRTRANPAPFGRRFFYDLTLANDVLGHEVAWHGVFNGRNQGFADEFARANVNLSLVEAQTRLLNSWRVLSTTLCECVDQDASLQGELAKTAESCLNANVEANLEQPGMDEIVKTRLEMAFVIISKLVTIKASDPAMKSLLPAAWDLVRASPVDYDVATAPEDLGYYRTLLQVLYLTIQPHAYIEKPPNSNIKDSKATEETKIDFLDPAVAACLVEIMGKTIAPGFRALCGNLHNSVSLAEPGDFALLSGLLQALLSVHGVASVHHQLAELVASFSLVRGALSLYSWADHLAEIMDQDPIYGEVAITFLLSLSTIRPVAEQIALGGALVQLSSANLSNYFRKTGGKGPFAEPRRMFAIWTEGFLPLCLNLLDAVGPPMAAEVATFLNSFPEQLRRAETALENREPSRQNPHAGAITLGLVSEAHSLCLVGLILASDIARGAAEGINAADVPTLEFDYKKVKEDAGGLMRQKTSLASRIVPVDEREQGWSATTAGVSGVDNQLQGMVIREVVGLLRCFGGTDS